MNPDRHDIDALIQDALKEEEGTYGALREPTLVSSITDLFLRHRRWLTWLMGLVTLAFFALCIYCAFRFFEATEVPEMLRWGAVFFFGLAATWAIKIWTWMEVQRNVLTREIKRLELQVAQLASRLAE